MTKIILVDDQRAALDVMQRGLQKQGWEVAGFSAPQEAFVALQQQKYDLGIFDIAMPGMTGIELFEKTRGWQPDMDAIFVTAWPEMSTAIDAVQLGARDYLRRPFELRELVQAVNRALAHRSLRRKLEALHSFANSLKPSQALQDILAETMGHVAMAISPHYLYLAFIEREGMAPAWGAHGLTAEQQRHIQGTRTDVKQWLAHHAHTPSHIIDIREDFACPLRLEGVNALLIALIFDAQELVGGLLCGAPSPEAFSVDDDRFLIATGQLLSHALQQALLQEQLKKQESLRQHYQDTIEYLRAVAGGLAHDLKNPLATIGGTAQQALRALDNPGALSKDLRLIYDQAVRANAQMDELLGFCARTDVLTLTTQDANPLVQDIVDRMCQDGLPEGVDLAAHLADSPLPVACDDLQLQRALRNVITNAMRATQRYGQGTVIVTITAHNENAQIRVHNVGEPIIPELWEEIFKPRFTRPPLPAGSYQRSGYGLAIARGVLRSHGGEVVVEASDARRGTIFLVTLPLDPTALRLERDKH